MSRCSDHAYHSSLSLVISFWNKWLIGQQSCSDWPMRMTPSQHPTYAILLIYKPIILQCLLMLILFSIDHVSHQARNYTTHQKQQCIGMCGLLVGQVRWTKHSDYDSCRFLARHGAHSARKQRSCWMIQTSHITQSRLIYNQMAQTYNKHLLILLARKRCPISLSITHILEDTLI